MPQYHGIMCKEGPKGPFHPTFAEIVTTDRTKFLAWYDRMAASGYQAQDDYEQHLNMLRAMSRRRQAELSKPYEPTPQDVANMRANKPSGYGQKPWAKQVREPDKKVVTSKWTPLPGGR